MTGPRRKWDWVYRSYMGVGWSEDDIPFGAPEAGNQASYVSEYSDFNSGPSNTRFLVLYDSTNRLQVMGGADVSGATVLSGLLPRSARAEGRRAMVRAVEGTIHVEPSSWALGNTMVIGWRLGVWEQDSETGFVLLDSEYTMWSTGVNNVLSNAGQFANRHNWVRERRIIRPFNNQVGGAWQFNVNWRGRPRSLGPDQAFGLYLEARSTSVNMRINPWLRSLVSDEG